MGTILSLLVLAASGDVNVVLKTNDVTLTSGQKTKLSSAITAVFPSAIPANIQGYNCSRLPNRVGGFYVKCGGTYTNNKTLSDWIDAVIAGEVGSGDKDSFVARALDTELNTAQKTALTTFVVDAFAGITLTDLLYMTCWRDGTDIKCHAFYDDTISAANFETLWASGNVHEAVSRVP